MSTVGKQLLAIVRAHALPQDAEGRAVQADLLEEHALTRKQGHQLCLPLRVRCETCLGAGLVGYPAENEGDVVECYTCNGSGSEPYPGNDPYERRLRGYGRLMRERPDLVPAMVTLHPAQHRMYASLMGPSFSKQERRSLRERLKGKTRAI